MQPKQEPEIVSYDEEQSDAGWDAHLTRISQFKIGQREARRRWLSGFKWGFLTFCLLRILQHIVFKF